MTFNAALTKSFCTVLFVILLVYFAKFNSYVLKTLVTQFSIYDSIMLVGIGLILLTLSVICTNVAYYTIDYVLTWSAGIVFMVIFICSSNLLLTLISLVGFSIAVYTLILVDYTLHAAREACIKYYYLSVVCVALIVYGFFLTYVMTSQVEYTACLETINRLTWETANKELFENYIQLSGIFILLGFFFKLAVFPAHFWAPSVYQGVSDFILGFFMVPSKLIVLSVFLKIVLGIYAPVQHLWTNWILFCGLFSLIWGALWALKAYNLRLFLAYTSINQMGFILLCAGKVNQALQFSGLLYVFIYAVMSLFFFAVVFRTWDSATKRPLMYLSDFATFGKQHPGAAINLAIVMFAMAGIPPLLGFFGKFVFLVQIWQNFNVGVLAIVLVMSLVSAFYYLRIIKLLFWTKTSSKFKEIIWSYNAPTRLIALFNLVIWTPIVYFDYVTDYLGMLNI